MTEYKTSVRRAALVYMFTAACGVSDQVVPEESEQSAASTFGPGSCSCAVTVDVYDDSCGAGCGQIGTTDWYTEVTDSSEFDCIQWCQHVAWYVGNISCSEFSPDSQAAYLHWRGRWGFEPYFVYDQLYACSDL